MTNNDRQSKTSGQLAAIIAGTFTEHRGGDRTAMQNEKQNDKATETDGPELVPKMDQSIQDHLGRKLRAVYDEIVSQPVPDKFRKLLEELERREKTE